MPNPLLLFTLPLSALKKLAFAEWLSVSGLAAASAVAGFFASKYQVFNADATISIYLFKTPFHLHDILLADWHTNLLKIPLLLLQAHLPLNITTFTIANIVLIFSTLLGWNVAASVGFGRRYFLPLTLLATLILSGTVLFPSELSFTTTRNIEYPLLFAAFLLFWRKIAILPSLQAMVRTPATYLFIVIMFLLQVSDPYFTFMSLPALLGTLAWGTLKGKVNVRVLLSAACVAFSPTILAKLAIAILYKTGIFIYYGEGLPTKIKDFNTLPQSAWNAIHDLTAIMNADLFNLPLSRVYAIHFIMMVPFLLLAYAYIKHLRRLPETAYANPLLTSLLLASVTMLFLYILMEGFDHQFRYILIVALVALITVVHEVVNRKRLQRLLIYHPLHITISLLVLSAIVGMFTFLQYKNIHAYSYSSNKANVLAINALLERERVNTIIAGHSYSSPVAFWAKGNVQYIPILYCNQNLPFLTRKSWYGVAARPTSDHVALIVDKLGRDANSWYCSEAKIQEYYGKPLATYDQAGIDNIPVKVLIYPKNIISKILFITTPGAPQPLLSR